MRTLGSIGYPWVDCSKYICEVARTLRQSGDIDVLWSVADLGVVEAFVAAEEEQLVFKDRAGKRSSVVVLMLRRLFCRTRRGRDFREVTPRIECGISDKVEDSAVELVAARI